MSDSPRRRRSDDDTGGGLPLFPLIIIVIFAGLLLGGVLAHFFGGSGGAGGKGTVAVASAPPTPLPTPLNLAMPHTPRTPPTLLRTTAPSPTASSSPVASASPKATTSPRPSPASTASPNVTPTAERVALKPSTQPKTPAPAKTASAATATPARAAEATPAPNYVSPGATQAAGIVRSYLGALARGDRATATSYLASGLPGETFMSPDSRIVSMHSVQTTPSQYRVTADVRASAGEYYITFTLEPGTGGLQIVDHYSIRM